MNLKNLVTLPSELEHNFSKIQKCSGFEVDFLRTGLVYTSFLDFPHFWRWKHEENPKHQVQKQAGSDLKKGDSRYRKTSEVYKPVVLKLLYQHHLGTVEYPITGLYPLSTKLVTLVELNVFSLTSSPGDFNAYSNLRATGIESGYNRNNRIKVTEIIDFSWRLESLAFRREEAQSRIII